MRTRLRAEELERPGQLLLADAIRDVRRGGHEDERHDDAADGEREVARSAAEVCGRDRPDDVGDEVVEEEVDHDEHEIGSEREPVGAPENEVAPRDCRERRHAPAAPVDAACRPPSSTTDVAWLDVLVEMRGDDRCDEWPARQRRPEASSGLDVQRPGRLVEQDELGITDERPREGELLQLPERAAVRALRQELTQLELVRERRPPARRQLACRGR